MTAVVIDGGDLGCTALLLRLNRELRGIPAGTAIAVVTTDPAAPIDLPAWCHLAGHTYRGRGTHTDGRPSHRTTVSAATRPVHPDRPWHASH